jgi:molybdopterin converting factor small subunit
MIVHVRLSAALAQVAGVPRVALTLPEGATVADLLAELRQQYPLLESRLATALPFVGGSHAAAADEVTDRAEVALLLPAAGGAGSSRRPQACRRLAFVAPDVS